VRDWRDELLRIAFHFVGNWDDAEDVAQTTLFRAFHSLGRFDPSRPFAAWLFRIHLNNCRSHYRRKRWERLFRLPLDVLHDLPSVDHFDQEGIINLIRGELRKLSWNQQAAFVMMAIEERSSEEAAALMNCSPATARVHLARARTNLRQSLQRFGFHYD
jgi:RNA polymerase sigma-70 factor (ECF subfamily)